MDVPPSPTQQTQGRPLKDTPTLSCLPCLSVEMTSLTRSPNFSRKSIGCLIIITPFDWLKKNKSKTNVRFEPTYDT